MENKRKEMKENVVSFVPTGDYYYKKALQALSKDQFDKAHKYLRRAADLSPDDPLILMQYGIVEMELENFEHALQLLRRANSKDPNEAEIVFFLSEVSAHLGHTKEAMKYANEYIEMDPEGAYAEEAIEIIDFAQQHEGPELAETDHDSEIVVLQEQARKLMEQGDFKSAIEQLEQLIEEHPDFWSAFNNLSLAYFYIGETEQARALLHQVLRESSGNLHALCNLAVIAYYEKDEEELQELLTVLSKIKPYLFEHRYKLGATFALVGRHEDAYKWLRSLQKRGFDGDPGFYFWLAHAAYFSGRKEIAQNAWRMLLLLDPTKEGFEPWTQESLQAGDHIDRTHALEHSRDYIVEKLENDYRSERMFGLFLLSKTVHKQEIISHPKWIDMERYSTMEKWLLAYALDHQFDAKDARVKPFLKSIEVANLLYEKYNPVTLPKSFIYQMWFVLCERAIEKDYAFKNPAAIAAATDYMFQSSRMPNVTKKAIAEEYQVSAPTLTKYVNELIQFLPLFDA